MRKTTAHRIFEVSQELSATDRVRAGNVSLKGRSDGGHIWKRIHAFRAMPYGTPGHDAAWRAERDAIMALLHGHCDRCARPIDIAVSHPHEEWNAYLEEELRFAVTKEGDYEAVPQAAWLVPAVIDNDIKNHNLAGAFFRSGFPDGDFLAPRSTIVPEPFAWPLMPTFSGVNAFWRTEMIAHWRKEVADLRASSSGSLFQKRMFYWFAASNILALYRDENMDAGGLGYLTLNRRNVRSTDVIAGSALTTLGEALYRHYYPDLTDLSDTPWFMRGRLFLAPANILITEPGNLLTIPPGELDADGAWLPEGRARFASILNDMLGFTVLAASGPVEV